MNEKQYPPRKQIPVGGATSLVSHCHPGSPSYATQYSVPLKTVEIRRSQSCVTLVTCHNQCKRSPGSGVASCCPGLHISCSLHLFFFLLIKSLLQLYQKTCPFAIGERLLARVKSSCRFIYFHVYFVLIHYIKSDMSLAQCDR